MPFDQMTGEALPYDDQFDELAMQEAMGGGAPADPAMGGETVAMQVPGWAVDAVTELISILESEIASGNISPDALMGGGMPPAGGGMGGGMPPAGGMGGGMPF